MTDRVNLGCSLYLTPCWELEGVGQERRGVTIRPSVHPEDIFTGAGPSSTRWEWLGVNKAWVLLPPVWNLEREQRGSAQKAKSCPPKPDRCWVAHTCEGFEIKRV